MRPALLRVAVLLAASMVARPIASAQDIRPQYKATVGLGLFGAELGLYLPTAFGYTETWSLITFPIVGAAGGAIGGYYIDRAGSPAASVSVLVVSLALAVPTVILTVGNTRYSTHDLERDTRARIDRMRLAGDGFLRLSEGEWRLAAPGVAVDPLLRVDATSGAVSHSVGLRVTLISGSF